MMATNVHVVVMGYRYLILNGVPFVVDDVLNICLFFLRHTEVSLSSKCVCL